MGRGQHAGAWGQEQSSLPLGFQRREERELGRAGGTVPPSFLPLVFGISFCPLFILPPRVLTVLGVITENSVPHPFKFQAVKRLQLP